MDVGMVCHNSTAMFVPTAADLERWDREALPRLIESIRAGLQILRERVDRSRRPWASEIGLLEEGCELLSDLTGPAPMHYVGRSRGYLRRLEVTNSQAARFSLSEPVREIDHVGEVRERRSRRL